MNKLLKIDNIMYYVSDLDKSEAFYQDVLGLKKVWRDDQFKMVGFVFEESDAEIVIQSDPNLPKFDYSFLVKDVVAFCDEIKSKGYKVLVEPFDVRPGKYAVLADLDGNAINIIDLTKFNGIPQFDK